MRSVPREHEARNETWLSDRDRYSHMGLDSEDRLLNPQIRENGEWKSVSWADAMQRVGEVVGKTAAEELGLLMSPSASNEEYFLAQSILRQLGCSPIAHRLRQSDFSDDHLLAEPVFEKTIAELSLADAVVLVGCNPRDEAPIIGHRVRQAWRKGAAVTAINPVDWSFHFDTSLDAIVAPQHMVGELASLANAVAQASNRDIPDELRDRVANASISERHEALARRLIESASAVMLFGHSAISHGQASILRALSRYIAASTGTAFNTLSYGSNAVGAVRYGAIPGAAGKNAGEMLSQALSTVLLWDFEPDFDTNDPVQATRTLGEAGTVIAVTSYLSGAVREHADIALPLAPLAESEGSLLNFDGDEAGFAAAAKSRGEARSGWKILRRLAEELGLSGFSQVSLADVQASMNAVELEAPAQTDVPEANEGGLYRVGDVPMYSADALCRRSAPLQNTIQAQRDWVGINPADASRLGLSDGGTAHVRQHETAVDLPVRVTETVPAGAAQVASATCRMLHGAYDPIVVEVA